MHSALFLGFADEQKVNKNQRRMFLWRRLPLGGGSRGAGGGARATIKFVQGAFCPQAPSVTASRATFLSEEGFGEKTFTSSK